MRHTRFAATELGPDATIALITAAGIRGRGGAGFPTGRKWASLQTAITEADHGDGRVLDLFESGGCGRIHS